MLNVLRKEAQKNLLKMGAVTFKKDIWTTFNGTKYWGLLVDLDPREFDYDEYQRVEIYLEEFIDPAFKTFLGLNVNYKLHFFDYPKELKVLMDRLNRISKNTFIVGGAIRDIILGNTPKDFDIVTDVPYDDLKEVFKDFKQKEVGLHFKVLMVKIRGKEFEIANFRKDIYTDKNGKGAERVEIGTLQDDARRRDFDVNCLYYNPFTKTPILIDGNQTGLKSLQKKKFRFVGNPADRIKEDVLRLLRVAKLKKKGLEPTKETIRAFRRNFHLLCELGNSDRIRAHIEELCF